MNILTRVVPDIVRHLIEPIGESIIHKLVEDLGVANTVGQNIRINSLISSPSESTEDSEVAKVIGSNSLDATIAYNIDPNSLKWETSSLLNTPEATASTNSIGSRRNEFIEPLGRVYLTGVDRPANIMISISMHFQDIVDANATATKIFTKYRNGELFTINDIAYTYPLPEEIYHVMYGLYKMTPFSPESWLDLMSQLSSGRISLNVNRFDDRFKQLVVKRNLTEIFSQLEYGQTSPEAFTVDEAEQGYTVAFDIVTQLSLCSYVELKYPIIVCNKLVPDELLPMSNRDKPTIRKETLPYFNLEPLVEQYRDDGEVTQELVHVPWYDVWEVPLHGATRVLGYKPFISVALTIDNTDELDVPRYVTIIDLAAPLGDYTLVQPILDSILEHGTKCLTFNAPISIAVYADDVALDRVYKAEGEPDQIQLSLVGTILTVTSARLEYTHRIIISEKEISHGNLRKFRWLTTDIIAKYKS